MNHRDILRIFRVPPTLESERLVLRMMDVKDSGDMFDYSAREDVTRYLLWSPHPDISYTRDYIKSVRRQYRRGDFFDWSIVLKSNVRMIGTVGYTRIDTPNNCGEIGYVLNPKYQNMGYATEAASLVVEFGFVTLGLNRIEAKYMSENTASRRVMEKVGMSFEGTMKERLLVKGRYRDISCCAITRKEYDEKKERENRDNGGNCKV
mgnify:FL=1